MRLLSKTCIKYCVSPVVIIRGNIAIINTSDVITCSRDVTCLVICRCNTHQCKLSRAEASTARNYCNYNEILPQQYTSYDSV